ncbi:MAG TPA: hypothetical protein VIL69_05275, partial [Roseomonas sp.]
MAAQADIALRAVNRFGLGAGPGELAEVARDPRGWAAAALARPAEPLPEVQAPDSAAGLGLFMARREAIQQARSQSAQGQAAQRDGMMAVPPARPDFVRTAGVLDQALHARIELA